MHRATQLGYDFGIAAAEDGMDKDGLPLARGQCRAYIL
jgi:hypothetical protein